MAVELVSIRVDKVVTQICIAKAENSFLPLLCSHGTLFRPFKCGPRLMVFFNTWHRGQILNE